MVLEEVVLNIFLMCISFSCLYLTFRRNAVLWPIIATLLFAVNGLYGVGIPFVSTIEGYVIPSPANYMLLGINWIFGALSLLISVRQAFAVFKKKQSAQGF